MYICIYVYMYICIYVCMYICIYVCMYLCIYVYMYICIYVYMYICIYVSAHPASLWQQGYGRVRVLHYPLVYILQGTHLSTLSHL